MKSPTKIFLFITFVYLSIKDLRYVKINGVNPLYLIIDKINGGIEESNGNK